MTRTYRIAVLECDTPFPSVNEKRGSYGDIFRDLLTKGLKNEALGGKGKDVSLDLSKWDVVTAQEYPNIEDVDGFLLTGSSKFFLSSYICKANRTQNTHPSLMTLGF